MKTGRLFTFLILFLLPIFAFANSTIFDCSDLNDDGFKVETLGENLAQNQIVISWQGERPKAFAMPYALQRSHQNVLAVLAATFPELFIPQSLKLIHSQVLDQRDLGGIYCPNQQEKVDELVLWVSINMLDHGIDIQGLIAHELVHKILGMRKIVYPRWFEEALALLIENRLTGELKTGLVDFHLNEGIFDSIQFDNIQGTLDYKLQSFYGQVQLLAMFLNQNFVDDEIQLFFLTQKNDEFLDQIFEDFQIAKLINRRDYLAESPKLRQFYYLYSNVVRSRHRKCKMEKGSTCLREKERSYQNPPKKKRWVSRSTTSPMVILKDQPRHSELYDEIWFY